MFYAKDAFEGLSLMDRLVDPESRGDLVRQTAEAAQQALGRPGRTAFSVPEEALDTGGSTVRDVEPISPPFWGAREMDRVDLSDVWAHLDLKTLFRLHWGGKGVKDEAWEELQRDEFLPRLARMQRDAIEQGWLWPRIRYGYFPANRDGNNLELRLKGFAARVAQHETDHLDGVLFLDRMTSMQSLSFLDEYSRFHGKEEDD